jgi:plasmid stabilization system protein ParE
LAEVTIHAAAELEYATAFGWYVARSERAAIRFEAAFEEALDQIAQLPEAQPLRDQQHRYCSLKRYPYVIVYRVTEERVQVVAVAHGRQLPSDWASRI